MHLYMHPNPCSCRKSPVFSLQLPMMDMEEKGKRTEVEEER